MTPSTSYDDGEGGNMADTVARSAPREYVFNTASDLGREQLDYLETLADTPTTTMLDSADGPFDLIHARMLLMHLSRREEILAELIDALAPSGWLLIGEIGIARGRCCAPQRR